MEVKSKSKPQQIYRYWPRYWRRSVFLVICMQLIAVLLVALGLLIMGVIEPSDYRFSIVLAAMLVSVIGINLLLLPILTEPLRQLAAALSHAVGEESSVQPPNPNTERYRTNGIQPLLKTIYGLGAARSKHTPSSATSTLLDAAFNQNTAGIVVLDADQKVVYHNAAAPIIVNQDDGNYTLNLLFYTETSFDQWLKTCEHEQIHATKTWQRIADKPPGDEDRRIFDVVASYQKGDTASVVLLLIDRTHDYAPEDDALNFISFAAHELRGPITVIRGYLDTLLDEMDAELTDDQRELFERLVVSSNRLSSYINNILNTAKYDRRHLNMHLVETTVQNVYDIVADDMQLRAHAQRRLLAVSFADDLPTIAADPASLSEVFANLIDNAIKYSNEGGSVEVAADVHGDFVEVRVTDHGIGMPPNVVSNLFHKFYRSHRSRETVAGTGIGLYISKAILESHGGTMTARSVEGAGSTFTFAIPTYASVADKLKASDGTNKMIIRGSHGGWIKNHGVIKG